MDGLIIILISFSTLPHEKLLPSKQNEVTEITVTHELN